MASEEEFLLEPGPFSPRLSPGPEGLGRFRPLPTITTPDGVVHVDEELLRRMTPEQREIYNAFIEAYRVDPRAIGAAPAPSEAPPVDAPLQGFPPSPSAAPEPAPAPQFLPGPIVMPPPGGGVSGKRGTDTDIYALLGRLSADGGAVIRPDGTAITQLPPDVAYDPATREVYHIPAPALDRATFLPLARRAGGGIELAIPQAIQGALDAIDRALERQRRGLIVPDSTLNREAIEVAGMATSGSFGMAQAGNVARQMVGEVAPAPGAVRRLVGAPPGAVADPSVTPLAPGFALGTAGLGSPPKPPRPPAAPTPRPQLDQSGFYSQAERAALEVLPPRAPGTDMLGILTSPRGRVAEAEIRDMHLDSFLLGDEAATARRAVMKRQTDISDYQRRIEDLRRRSLEPGANMTHIRQLMATYEDTVNMARRNLATDEAKLAKVLAANPPRQMTSEAVARYAREHRVRLTETVYKTPEYDPDIVRDITSIAHIFQRDMSIAHTIAQRARVSQAEGTEAVGTVLNMLDREGLNPVGLKRALEELAIYQPEVVPFVRQQMSRIIGGHSVDRLTAATHGPQKKTTFSGSTIDPRNTTNKEIILRIASPDNDEAARILSTMPEYEARIIAWMEGRSQDDMVRAGLRGQDIHAVLNARSAYPAQVAQLRALAQRGVWLGGHFSDPSWLGVAMTSIQPLADGRRALFLNQLQSDWTNAIEAGATSVKNVMVSGLSRWVDPMLRRVLREAVENGADAIVVPNGTTVRRYNDVPDTIQRLYNQVYPRRMTSVMREIDSAVPKAGTALSMSDLLLSTGQPRRGTLDYDRAGQLFEITPAIRAHFQQGRGMRILSGSGDDPLASVAAGTLAEALRGRGIAVTDISEIGVRAKHPKEPVLAYHGTRFEFDRFRDLDSPSRSGIGHHFGTQEQANTVVNASNQQFNTGTRVIPAILDVRSPITLRDAGGWDPASTLMGIRQTLRRRAGTSTETMDRLDNMITAYNRRLTDRQEHAAFGQIHELLEDLGFDSIRYHNIVEGRGWSYIIWQQGQAISATDRRHRLFSGSGDDPTAAITAGVVAEILRNRDALRQYARSLIITGNVHAIGTVNGRHLFYDLGRRNQDVISIIESTPGLDLDIAPSIFRHNGRYYTLATGAGRDLIETTLPPRSQINIVSAGPRYERKQGKSN